MDDEGANQQQGRHGLRVGTCLMPRICLTAAGAAALDTRHIASTVGP